MRKISNQVLSCLKQTPLLLSLVGAGVSASDNVAPAHNASAASASGITMTGLCRNGEAFRLVAYEKQVDGVWKSFYDYQGPVGVGTVKTKTAPKVMASRVCIALAEVASDEH